VEIERCQQRLHRRAILRRPRAATMVATPAAGLSTRLMYATCYTIDRSIVDIGAGPGKIGSCWQSLWRLR
jgi:hypothetical protein